MHFVTYLLSNLASQGSGQPGTACWMLPWTAAFLRWPAQCLRHRGHSGCPPWRNEDTDVPCAVHRPWSPPLSLLSSVSPPEAVFRDKPLLAAALSTLSPEILDSNSDLLDFQAGWREMPVCDKFHTMGHRKHPHAMVLACYVTLPKLVAFAWQCSLEMLTCIYK